MRKILLLMLVLVSSAAHAERRLTQEFHWHLGAG